MFNLRITERVHQCIQPYIQKGDWVIDGTAGQGYDTLFLAQQVGQKGTVLSFDIQKKAIEATERMLRTQTQGYTIEMLEDNRNSFYQFTNVPQGVYLIHQSHEKIDYFRDYLGGGTQPIACIMFNLGYLPNGDKKMTTHTQSTEQAILKSLELLKEGGIISLVTYPGHEEGMREDEAIQKLLKPLPGKKYEIIQIQYVNRSEKAPKQYLIYKRCCQTTDNAL